MGSKKKAKTAAKAEHDLTKHLAKRRNAPIVAAMGQMSEIADQPPLVAISAATLLAGAALRRPALARAGARMLVAHAIATGAKALIKNAVDRSRPARAIEDGRHTATRRHASGEDSDFNSFPSGHTAGAVGVARAVSHELSSASMPAYAGAAFVGALQLPRGAHYLSDVAAGAVIGWGAEWLAGIAMTAGERAVRSVRAERVGRSSLDEAQAHPS